MSKAAVAPQGRRFSIAHLAIVVPWVALAIDAWKPIADNSFLWHVRAGTLQNEAGTVLTSDPFSFTVGGDPWLTQSWLIELMYDKAEVAFGGLDFVPWMLLLFGGIAFVGVGLIAYRHSHSVPATAFVMVLNVLVLISFIVPRPVLVSYGLMVLVVLAWDSPKARWAVPFLFWVWASVHASFLVGLAYIGISLLIRREWREIPKAAVSGLVTLFTAHGLGILSFLSAFGDQREALGYLTEWRRPSLLEPVFLPFLGALVFIAIGFVRRKVPIRWLWLAVPFAVLGFTSLRAVPPAWLALVPLVGMSMEGLSIGSRAGLSRRPAVAFYAAVLVLPLLLLGDAELAPDRFPLEAIGELSDEPVFHDDIAGGFIIWAEGPQRKVYIDDRAELYGERLGEFVEIRKGNTPWEPVFERDGIRQALLRNDEDLIDELEEAGWRIAYRDDDFSLLRP